jgi:hypothetical protein
MRNCAQKRKDLGICYNIRKRGCTNPVVPGKSSCAECLDLLAQKIAQHRANRKARGLCTRCTKPARPGGLLCEDHRIKVSAKERRPETKENPELFCLTCKVSCGRVNQRYCPEHREEGLRCEAAARTGKTASGKTCTYCGIYGHNPGSCRKRLADLRRKCPICRTVLSPDSHLLSKFCSDTCRKENEKQRPPPVIPGLVVPARVDHILTRLGIHSLPELYRAYHRGVFDELRNFGTRSLRDLTSALEKTGLPPLSDLQEQIDVGHHEMGNCEGK